jgi:hypothetical protein
MYSRFGHRRTLKVRLFGGRRPAPHSNFDTKLWTSDSRGGSRETVADATSDLVAWNVQNPACRNHSNTVDHYRAVESAKLAEKFDYSNTAQGKQIQIFQIRCLGFWIAVALRASKVSRVSHVDRGRGHDILNAPVLAERTARQRKC